jgi:hypothetical protein
LKKFYNIHNTNTYNQANIDNMPKYSLHCSSMFCLGCKELECKRVNEYPPNIKNWVNLLLLDGEREDYRMIGHLYQKKGEREREIENEIKLENKIARRIKNLWNMSKMQIVL